ncbi:unnamed protein product [Effrenium voratum]|uniref:Uncharacterized protein n=1 Tax=Effrenium voratum TaxID=2562239 RepID=A0AA36IJA0_9DINO|nr:unnamed protein product [Effrenium voratum]
MGALNLEVRGWRTTVVTDRHALAAHEFWHRKTGGCWMDPQWLEDGTRYSSSGRLLAVCAVPEARDELAQKRVRIRFAAADQVAVVDFAVEELSNTEFEVRVLEEARGRRALPDRLEDKVYLSPTEYASLRESLVGSPAAVGRVRTLDIVGGWPAADMRQCARHELSFQERERKEIQVRNILARQARQARRV